MSYPAAVPIALLSLVIQCSLAAGAPDAVPPLLGPAEEEQEEGHQDAQLPWVERMAQAFDPRPEFDVWATRATDTEGTTAGMVAFLVFFEKAPGLAEPEALDLLQFVPRFDPIWDGDKLLEDLVVPLAERIRYLSPKMVEAWQDALEAVHEDGVSELWSVGFMVSLDRMFTDDGLETPDAELLLSRLSSIPGDSVAALAEPMGIGKAQAAVAIIPEDSFFEEGVFDTDAFYAALEELSALIERDEEQP